MALLLNQGDEVSRSYSYTKPSPTHPVMPTFCGARTANLVDESKVTLNTYISYIGVTGSSTVTNLTDYIDISASPFVISGVRTTDVLNTSTRGLCFYDSDKNYISGVLYSPDVMSSPAIYSNIPENAKYVRFAFDKSFENGIMLNLGGTALPFEPFGWAEKITCAGQTTPVYLGQVSTVRRIRKLVLDGTEAWETGTQHIFNLPIATYLRNSENKPFCTHYTGINPVEAVAQLSNGETAFLLSSSGNNRFYIRDDTYTTVADFKSYLASEYAAGHPVTIWYALTKEQTGIVNEPLCKISTYADELHSTDAGVTIPTVKGSNTLTVDTELQPSEMSITYKG